MSDFALYTMPSTTDQLLTLIPIQPSDSGLTNFIDISILNKEVVS